MAPLCAVVALATATAAQPVPAVTPTAKPVLGMVGAGTLTITTLMLNPPAMHAMTATDAASPGATPVPAASPGPPMTASATVAFEVKPKKFRFDLVSVSLSGLGPAVAGMMPPFPAGGATAVADYSTGKLVVWVPSTKKYFVGKIPVPNFGKNATPSPHMSAAPMPMMDPFAVFKAFQGMKTFSIALTGHATSNGHPTSQYDLVLEREYGAGNTFAVHGQMQLADDIDELPVSFHLSVDGNKLPASSLRYELTNFERRVPPESDFHPPGGYKLVKNPGDAFKI